MLIDKKVFANTVNVHISLLLETFIYSHWKKRDSKRMKYEPQNVQMADFRWWYFLSPPPLYLCINSYNYIWFEQLKPRWIFWRSLNLAERAQTGAWTNRPSIRLDGGILGGLFSNFGANDELCRLEFSVEFVESNF